MIEVTEKAAKKALALAARDQKAPILRVGVKGGGCSGMSYFIDFDAPENVRDTDSVLELGELKVVVDPKSLKFIDGMRLDFETNLLNGGFRFHNPNAKRSCSCGESFTV